MTVCCLQLCDKLESSSYGAAQCLHLSGGCEGAGIGTVNAALCYPHTIWSGTLGSNGFPVHAYLDPGILGNHPTVSSSGAMGVRCVPDLNYIHSSADCLQLCDSQSSSSYGAAQCLYLNGGCQGGADNHCWVNDIWSGSEVESSSYHRGFGMNGSILQYNSGFCGAGMNGKCIGTYVFSVRCVLGLQYIFDRHMSS